jgi:drug/metabolite transporter, DME family
MPAEVLALGAALCFASGGIAVKFATQAGSMLVGYVASLATGVIGLGIVAAITVDSWAIPLGPALLFGLAGLAGPGAGRLLGMRAVRDAGASVALPVQSSANPLIASAAGVLLFGEIVGLGRVLALALIVGGILACARGGSANRVDGLDFARTRLPAVNRRLVLLLPLAAGGAYATADILRKFALAEHGDPILGAFVGMTAALLVWVTILSATPAFRQPFRMNRSIAWFCLNGVLSATASTSLMFALRIGDLSVVAPILASQPVIVVVLGALVLRDLERLRLGTVLGALTVFTGVAWLAFS